MPCLLLIRSNAAGIFQLNRVDWLNLALSVNWCKHTLRGNALNGALQRSCALCCSYGTIPSNIAQGKMPRASLCGPEASRSFRPAEPDGLLPKGGRVSLALELATAFMKMSDAQRALVGHTDGPLLAIAEPGSGKAKHRTLAQSDRSRQTGRAELGVTIVGTAYETHRRILCQTPYRHQ